MTWVKLEASRATHRKLRAAGFAARGLDEAALCQVSEDGTDGFLDDHAVAMLGAAHGEDDVARLAAKLVEVGRWERDDARGGFWVHGYLDYNPTRAEWDALLEARRESGRRGGEAKARARALANGVAKPLANDVANDLAKPLAVSFRSVDDLRSSPDAVERFPQAAADDDDEDRRSIKSEAIAILVDREAALQTARGNPPRSAAWREKTASERNRRHWLRVAEITAENPDITATELAELLEPSAHPARAGPVAMEVARLEGVLAGLRREEFPDADSIRETEERLARLTGD